MSQATAGAHLASAAVFLFVAVGCGGDDTGGAPPADGGADASPTDGSVVPEGSVADGARPSDATTPVDGGGDGSISDALTDAPLDSPSDAPSDVSSDAPEVQLGDGGLFQPLSCSSWRYASPVTLEDLGANDAGGFYNSEVWVTSPAAGQVRVIVQPSSGPTFRLYGFDKSSSAVTTLDGPSDRAAGIQSVRPFALASSHVSEILLQSDSDDSGPASQLSAILVDDTMPMTGPLPSPIALSLGFGSAVAIPFDTQTVFDAVTYLESTAGPTLYYGLGVGLATATKEATLANVSISTEATDFGLLAAAHASGNVYVFGTNASSHAGESVWTVPDTALVSAPAPTPRAFDTGDEGHMIDVAAASSSAGSTNLAYWTMATDGSSSAIHVGQVTNGDLAIVTAPDLITARTYPNVTLSDATVAAAWHGDDMMIIGPPGSPSTDGGAASGVSLLWVNAFGVVRAEQVGADALLQSRTGIRLAGASPASISGATAAWDVAWIETHADGSETLLYNELDCDLGD